MKSKKADYVRLKRLISQDKVLLLVHKKHKGLRKVFMYALCGLSFRYFDRAYKNGDIILKFGKHGPRLGVPLLWQDLLHDYVSGKIEATGVDAKDIVAEIGREISWADIVNHTFRALELDRSDTTIEKNNQVKAKSSFKPYGYLLVESPILNNRVRLPIIHRDDFLLAASVFDEPKLAALVVDEELLVTYAPKHLLPKGLSGSTRHVLHYVITPRGTLDSYYSKNNDMYMAKPDPQKLFGSFVYEGEIKVQINSEPEF